jgi:eukaryotic-like serine/threonine-protein kinase
MAGQRIATAPLRAHDPRQLGAYRLIGRLGEGGMGTVYLGETPDGTPVAVKVVRADLAPDEEFRRRFRSEVNRVRQVPPFCTAEVIDADADHELPYLVVEYVDGPSLAEVVAGRGPLNASHLYSVAIGVATALTAIHGAGVIHRDLKPRNVLLAPGSPKVIDFGIARALEGNTSHTRTDQMVGTVAYMAPERFGDAVITPAADIFAWGAVVAYAGTGRTPFHADTPTATAARILTEPPDLAGLGGPLRELVEYALEKDPARRPDARQLLDMLVTSKQRAPERTTAREGGKGGRKAILGTLLLLTLAAGTAVTIRGDLPWARSSPEDPASSAPPPVRTRVVSDALARAGAWQETADDEEAAECTFADETLIARRAGPGSFRCRGPARDQPDDVQVEVNVRLLAKGSCAAIWFRFRPYQGYQVRICEQAILIGTHKSATARALQTFPLAEPLAVRGTAARITLTVRGGVAEVARDGRPVGAVPLTDPDIAAGGRIVLGLFTEPKDDAHTEPYAVAFDHVDFYTLS